MAVKHRIKEEFYNRLPSWSDRYSISCIATSFRRLPRRVHDLPFLQGFWYRFLAAAKVAEYDQTPRRCANTQERLEALSRLPGYDLREFQGQ
jgi:hypothetical protein